VDIAFSGVLLVEGRSFGEVGSERGRLKSSTSFVVFFTNALAPEPQNSRNRQSVRFPHSLPEIFDNCF
jgi:hypothetical protein